ncbi:LytR/AlgR family response regulator transcription factor [Bacteroidota bacterium]
MRILIIEDEEAASGRLIKLLAKIDKDYEIIGILESIKSSVKWFKENKTPDLVFLDIQLADGLSFNIFSEVEVESPIIFTTAYDQYAINAFQLNSVDYLLKPINVEALESSLQKLEKMKEVFTPQVLSNQFKQLLADVSSGKKPYKSRFLINKGDVLLPITTNEIAYFYTEEKVVFLITSEGKRHIINFTLDNLEKQLNPLEFFRANRQFILSNNSIKQIHNYFNYKLKVEVQPEPEMDIIISRIRVNDFKNWLNN